MPFRCNAQAHHVAAVVGLVLTVILAGAVAVAAQTSVTTYHNDNYRTGWNSTETVLTPANVNPAQFGILKNVVLDDQVDAQPLIVPNVNVTAGLHPGTYNVVYVATGSNSIYAIDADNGVVLFTVNLGTPVAKPLGCPNNGPNVGIDSTPVIDLAASTMYVIAYNQTSTGPAYYVHALDLGSLVNKVTPVLVSASHTLTDGSSFAFNAKYQRQRPGLLEANGNIYAGFGSFCDFDPGKSRGWVLGWNTNTLTPLAANQVLDTQATSKRTYFLSSVWMSGYGLTADDSGHVLFTTGNSDSSGTTYDGVTDIQESVIKVSADLSTIVDLFTPSDWSTLDKTDGDFGSGGVLVLPDQPGSIPHMAVAAGKEGNLFLMNEDNLGGYSSTSNNVLGTVSIGACWCGQSYYVDPDGTSRIVSSGANKVEVWKLVTSPKARLLAVTSSAAIASGQLPGFFTSVSSNGNSNPIIWALSHPVSTKSTGISLYAYNPDAGGASMAPLFKGSAGSWTAYYGNSNLIPVVANGKVYVASNQLLRIFGLKPTAHAKKKK